MNKKTVSIEINDYLRGHSDNFGNLKNEMLFLKYNKNGKPTYTSMRKLKKFMKQHKKAFIVDGNTITPNTNESVPIHW